MNATCILHEKIRYLREKQRFDEKVSVGIRRRRSLFNQLERKRAFLLPIVTTKAPPNVSGEKECDEYSEIE